MIGFGQKLRELRGSTKQTEAAQALGINYSTYAMYEVDRREPNFETLVSIANHYGVTTDYLLGVSDCKSPEIEKQAICKKTGLSEKAVEILIGLKTRDRFSLDDDILSNKVFPEFLYDAVIEFINMRIESSQNYEIAAASLETAFIEEEKKSILSNYRAATRAIAENHPMIAQWFSSPFMRLFALEGKRRDSLEIESNHFIQKIKETRVFASMREAATAEENKHTELFAFQKLLHGESDNYTSADWD